MVKVKWQTWRMTWMEPFLLRSPNPGRSLSPLYGTVFSLRLSAQGPLPPGSPR